MFNSLKNCQRISKVAAVFFIPAMRSLSGRVQALSVGVCGWCGPTVRCGHHRAETLVAESMSSLRACWRSHRGAPSLVTCTATTLGGVGAGF